MLYWQRTRPMVGLLC